MAVKVKTEPKKTEPSKIEPKKVEPKKVETKKVEAKKTEPVKAEPKKAETKKTETKKAEPKKTEIKKTEEKKTAPKKSAVKKEIKINAIVEHQGRQVEEKTMVAAVKKEWTRSGKKVGDIKTIDLYIKPEENAVYYVINGIDTGNVAF